MWKIVLVKEQDRGLIVGGGGEISSPHSLSKTISYQGCTYYFSGYALHCACSLCVCVRCIGIWWGFRTLRFALQRTPLPPPPPPPPPQKAVYEVSWELVLTKTRAGTAARGAVCLNPAQARPPSETLCIYWNIYIYIHFWCRGKMLSVKSARQLCKVFFSLHVVFLSVALVESRASNGDQKGKVVLYRLIFMYVCVEFLFLFLFF